MRTPISDWNYQNHEVVIMGERILSYELLSNYYKPHRGGLPPCRLRPSATQMPTAAPTPEPTSPPPSPLPPAWQPALNAVHQDLVDKLGTNPEEIVFVSADSHDWTDSCLGLGRPEESCLAVITPGYLITVKVQDKTYLYHTDQIGTVVRLEPEPSPEGSYPPAVDAARRDAAVQAGIPSETVTVVEFELVNWPDSCLGVHSPSAMCLQVITPGYKIVTEANGVRSEYHTDETGNVIVLAATDHPGIVREVINWREEGENCLAAQVSLDGLIAAGACGGMQTVQPLSPEMAEQLSDWDNNLAGFNASQAGVALTFSGHGEKQPSDAEQRSLLEWTRAAALQAMGNPGSTSAGIAFTWHREGGIAGFCDDLVVYLSGDYYASSCKGEIKNPGRMHLSPEQLARLYAWIDTLAPFEIDHTDPATADAMTIRLSFTGAGQKAASETNQTDIQSFAGELFTAASAAPTPGELSQAEQALTAYFKLLNSGDFAGAVKSYGGSYSSLIAMNPDIDPADRAALLEAGCTRNGLVCLQVRNILDNKVFNRERIVFTVEFNTPEGELFVRGPCCGSTEAEMPSVSKFDYTVRLLSGVYKVMELPVYVP